MSFNLNNFTCLLWPALVAAPHHRRLLRYLVGSCAPTPYFCFIDLPGSITGKVATRTPDQKGAPEKSLEHCAQTIL